MAGATNGRWLGCVVRCAGAWADAIDTFWTGAVEVCAMGRSSASMAARSRFDHEHVSIRRRRWRPLRDFNAPQGRTRVKSMAVKRLCSDWSVGKDARLQRTSNATAGRPTREIAGSRRRAATCSGSIDSTTRFSAMARRRALGSMAAFAGHDSRAESAAASAKTVGERSGAE